MFSAPCAEATRACPSERRERVRASTPPCARLALARAARRARTERAEADATRKSGVKKRTRRTTEAFAGSARDERTPKARSARPDSPSAVKKLDASGQIVQPPSAIGRERRGRIPCRVVKKKHTGETDPETDGRFVTSAWLLRAPASRSRRSIPKARGRTSRFFGGSRQVACGEARRLMSDRAKPR